MQRTRISKRLGGEGGAAGRGKATGGGEGSREGILQERVEKEILKRSPTKIAKQLSKEF